MDSITVDDKGTKFAFLVPRQDGPYFTFIALHGMGFTSAIFRKVMNIAFKANIRFIAIARRGCQGSTPYSPAEIASATSGSDNERAEFVDARGLEIATLIDKLIQQLSLYPISDGGKTGGVGLLGWSAGNMWTLAALANIDKLPLESQSRLGAFLRANIIHDPPSLCLGLPLPPKIWSPLIDPTLPEEVRIPFYTSWITSYFDHGDLSSRNADEVNYHLPSIHRAPSIYNMSPDDMREVIDAEASKNDWKIMLATQRQSNLVYRKACYDPDIRDILPNMKTTVLVGGSTCSFAINGMFSIQDDNEKYGGQTCFCIWPGTNHFMQWDDPREAFDAYKSATFLQ